MGFENTLLIPQSSNVTPDILDSVATKDLILTVFLTAPCYVKFTRIWIFHSSSKISEHQSFGLDSKLPGSGNSSFGIFEGVMPSESRPSSPETLAERDWSSATLCVLPVIGRLALF